MKQKTITTDKATLLVVEMPEGITEIGNTDKRISIPDRKGGHHFVYGNWQLLGRLPDITEDRLMLILPIHRHSIIGDVYKDFTTGKYDAFDLNESLHSLLQTNEVYFDAGNTYIPHELGSMSATDHLERTLDVLDIKSKVWNKERTFLFIKVD